jgi:GTPase SAR1 family protein
MGGCIGSKQVKEHKTLGIKTETGSKDHKFKVVILGDVAVGKTSLLNVLKGRPVVSFNPRLRNPKTLKSQGRAIQADFRNRVFGKTV